MVANMKLQPLPPYLLLRHAVTQSVVFQPFEEFFNPNSCNLHEYGMGCQGGAEIGFSLFEQKWLDIQLSSKDIIFDPIYQLFKSKSRAL